MSTNDRTDLCESSQDVNAQVTPGASEYIPLFVRTEPYNPPFNCYQAPTEGRAAHMQAAADPREGNTQAAAHASAPAVSVPDVRFFGVLGGAPGAFPKPYYFDGRALASARTNRLIQLELLSAAICYHTMIEELDEAIAFCDANYRYLTTATPGLLDGLKIKPEVRKLRSTASIGLRLEQAQFDEAFAELIPYIPDLYRRTMSLEPAERIDAILQSQRRALVERINLICDSIGIPFRVQTTLDEKYQPRTQESLAIFAALIKADRTAQFVDVLPQYQEYLYNVEQGKRERNEKIVSVIKQAAVNTIGVGVSFLPFATANTTELITDIANDALGLNVSAADIKNELEKQTDLLSRDRAGAAGAGGPGGFGDVGARGDFGLGNVRGAKGGFGTGGASGVSGGSCGIGPGGVGGSEGAVEKSGFAKLRGLGEKALNLADSDLLHLRRKKGRGRSNSPWR